MKDSAALRVAIDAAILPWRNGGVAQALVSLVHALAELSDGDESYSLVVESEEEAIFWRSEIGSKQTVVVKPNAGFGTRRRADDHGVRAFARKHAGAWVDRIRRRLVVPAQWPEVPLSDGFYEQLGCDVLHLTWQRFVVCALPTIYNPHDLQHLHFPQFFSPRELAWRETMYPTGCRLARSVVVGSQWTKDDLVRQYALAPAKIQVIPEGANRRPAIDSSDAAIMEVKSKFRLPDQFLVYPAITWPHKNHLRLLDAVALLRKERGLVVPLVFTGTKLPEFWPAIDAHIRALWLEEQVYGLGFVSDAELRAILRSALAFIQPSLFEASSLPIYDAWFAGIPVVCSRAAALPDQVGGAGLLFDPTDVRDIADSIFAVVTEPTTREALRNKGFVRLRDFDWTRTARAYRAVYRKVAGRSLCEEDRQLLSWDWMKESTRPEREVPA